MPSLAALPQQTDADLLRPPVLANDQPYAVAGGLLPVPIPQGPTCKAARQASSAGPHQAGPAPSGRYHFSSMVLFVLMSSSCHECSGVACCVGGLAA